MASALQSLEGAAVKGAGHLPCLGPDTLLHQNAFPPQGFHFKNPLYLEAFPEALFSNPAQTSSCCLRRLLHWTQGPSTPRPRPCHLPSLARTTKQLPPFVQGSSAARPFPCLYCVIQLTHLLLFYGENGSFVFLVPDLHHISSSSCLGIVTFNLGIVQIVFISQLDTWQLNKKLQMFSSNLYILVIQN